MGTELQRIERGGGALAMRGSDGHADRFVIEHMARGEPVRVARMYTQSAASCVLQLGLSGIPIGLLGATVTASVLGGLAIGGAFMAFLGPLLLLETSNRIVITDRSLVVQTSVLLRRYELAHIRDARIETLGPREWLRLDMRIFDPRYFFTRAEGIRFRYEPPDAKPSEVFIAVAEAREHLRFLSVG